MNHLWHPMQTQTAEAFAQVTRTHCARPFA
jgi:hypothetical protein